MTTTRSMMTTTPTSADFDVQDELRESLSRRLPCFRIPGENVTILTEPKQLYEKLLSLAASSERRVVLATLYCGTGAKEKALVDTLSAALSTCGSLRCQILLDHARGTRGSAVDASSCSLLRPLVQQTPQRCKVHLFHSPQLRGLLKRLLPERWNEVVGLQHMKLYIFDDAIIFSGANLNDSYFTDRQDRYVLIEKCSELADFYSEIVDAVARCSFKLQPNGQLEPDEQCHVHPYKDSETAYVAMLRTRLMRVVTRHLESSRQNHTSSESDKNDTTLYPMIQFGPAAINLEDDVIKWLLEKPPRASSLMLASGYFNLTDEYAGLLLRADYPVEILAASPQANGFFNGSGVSGFIPCMYTHIAAVFMAHAQKLDLWQKRIRFVEYTRPDWTFHAKGMWWRRTQVAADHPAPTMATLVGSTNYGYRSAQRDLEAQVMIVTRNADLQRRLTEEQQHLLQHTQILDSAVLQRPDHHVPFWLRIVSRFLRHFF